VQLQGVRAIYSTACAFAAVLSDGTVEAWGVGHLLCVFIEVICFFDLLSWGVSFSWFGTFLLLDGAWPLRFGSSHDHSHSLQRIALQAHFRAAPPAASTPSVAAPATHDASITVHAPLVVDDFVHETVDTAAG